MLTATTIISQQPSHSSTPPNTAYCPCPCPCPKEPSLYLQVLLYIRDYVGMPSVTKLVASLSFLLLVDVADPPKPSSLHSFFTVFFRFSNEATPFKSFGSSKKSESPLGKHRMELNTFCCKYLQHTNHHRLCNLGMKHCIPNLIMFSCPRT